jgi:hypothetical protein
MTPATYKTRIERKHAKLPRHVVIPAHIPQAWEMTGTMTVVGTLNGVDIGRRGLKSWGDRRLWFFELPGPPSRAAAGVDTGDVIVTLAFAPRDVVPTKVRALTSSSARLPASGPPLHSGVRVKSVNGSHRPSSLPREKRRRSLSASKYRLVPFSASARIANACGRFSSWTNDEQTVGHLAKISVNTD